MLFAAARSARAASSRVASHVLAPSRTFAAAAAPPPAAGGADADPEHAAWLAEVRAYPVSIPHFEWTLEWMLRAFASERGEGDYAARPERNGSTPMVSERTNNPLPLPPPHSSSSSSSHSCPNAPV